METVSGITEDFNLTYVWWNCRLHKITDKIEDFLRKISYTMLGIKIQLEYNWKKKWRHSVNSEDLYLTYVW